MKIYVSFFQYSIYLLKRRIYCALRENVNINWPSILGEIVSCINATPRASLGNLKPSDFESQYDNYQLDDRIGITLVLLLFLAVSFILCDYYLLLSPGITHLPPFSEWFHNQEKYLGNTNLLQKGQTVYCNTYPDSAFKKSFDIQASTKKPKNCFSLS